MNASDEPAPAGALNFRNILVAVDLSPHSEATAAYAAKFAQAFGASLTLAHVCHLDPFDGFGTVPELCTASEWQWAIAQERLADLARSLRETCPDCKETIMVGDPAERVAWLARTLNADLIVVGSRHVHLLGRLLGLDQATKVVHRAPCPVLVYDHHSASHNEADKQGPSARFAHPANPAEGQGGATGPTKSATEVVRKAANPVLVVQPGAPPPHASGDGAPQHVSRPVGQPAVTNR